MSRKPQTRLSSAEAADELAKIFQRIPKDIQGPLMEAAGVALMAIADEAERRAPSNQVVPKVCIDHTESTCTCGDPASPRLEILCGGSEGDLQPAGALVIVNRKRRSPAQGTEANTTKKKGSAAPTANPFEFREKPTT